MHFIADSLSYPSLFFPAPLRTPSPPHLSPFEWTETATTMLNVTR